MNGSTLSAPHWPSLLLKTLVPGTCGALAHSLLMYLKARLGILPAFAP